MHAKLQPSSKSSRISRRLYMYVISEGLLLARAPKQQLSLAAIDRRRRRRYKTGASDRSRRGSLRGFRFRRRASNPVRGSLSRFFSLTISLSLSLYNQCLQVCGAKGASGGVGGSDDAVGKETARQLGSRSRNKILHALRACISVRAVERRNVYIYIYVYRKERSGL